MTIRSVNSAASRKVPTRKKTAPTASGRKIKKKYPPKHRDLNHPFPSESSFYGPGQAGSVKLSKGYIVINDAADSRNGSILHFLYNPQTITYTSSVLRDFLSPEYRAPGNNDRIITPGLTTIQFNLFFDRTYEMALNPTDPKWRRGTISDVDGLTAVTNIGRGFLIQQKIKIIFGNKYAPVFDGFVDNVQVSHTRFNTGMVPMTTEIGLGFRQLNGDPNVTKGPPLSIDDPSKGAGAAQTPAGVHNNASVTNDIYTSPGIVNPTTRGRD
jgi:hypothetical protein